jgi:beta-1,2-mannobiose phosphorylase / 1,2-beta-oligomannan phosphorylase
MPPASDFHTKLKAKSAMLNRNLHNPLITPDDVKPSRPDFEILGTFNAGAATYKDEVILLLRVSERPAAQEDGIILCPHLSSTGELIVERIAQDSPDYDTHDPRKIFQRKTGDALLTSISHLRLARSKDGVHFSIDEKPWLQAEPPYEGFGVEDARITQIGDTYYVNYTAVSEHGIATALVSTADFVQIKRLGIILPPANRDVTIFPQRINGQYVCYHRPMPGMFGRMNMWMATSPDLIHWGNHRILLEQSGDESGRIGGGATPIWTERGWLSIYHTADADDRYCLGAFLTPHDEPGRIIARSRQPILSPEEGYETEGFYNNVVFTCGAVEDNGILRLYYGAADERIALAEVSINDLLDSL